MSSGTDPRDYDGPFDGSVPGWIEGRRFISWMAGKQVYTRTWTEANKLVRENPEKYAVWRALRALGVKDGGE